MRLSFYLAIFLMMSVSATVARSEIYEPGRGILLPKKSLNAPNVFPLNNNNNAPTVIQKGQITQQPKANAPIVVNPGQNNKGTSAEAQKMTAAYAGHLYTAVCSQEYRESLAPKTEPNMNLAKLWADVQASCKCLTQQMLSVVPAPDLADYVMYNYSADTPQTQNTARATYFQSGQSSRIEALVANNDLRKKCGFLK